MRQEWGEREIYMAIFRFEAAARARAAGGSSKMRLTGALVVYSMGLLTFASHVQSDCASFLQLLDPGCHICASQKKPPLPSCPTFVDKHDQTPCR